MLRAGLGAFLLSTLTPVYAASGGWADVPGTPTGGAGGPTVTATTNADLRAYMAAAGPYIIQVQGTINLGSSYADISSNKTLVGVGAATLVGNLRANGVSNIIIRNLTFTNPNVEAGDGDGITVTNSQRIWIDRCTFFDCADGCLDITNASDYVTVSWCKFYYVNQGEHRFVNLIGGSDSSTGDRGKLRVTFHHNWWSTLCHERMPRVRYGHVHVYNNYYNAPGNNQCIRAAIESQVLVENNYFESVNRAWEYYYTTGVDPLIRAVGNVFVNTAVPAGGNDIVFVPPYSYTLDPANDVKSLVMAGAGAGNTTPPPSGPNAPSGLTATAVSTSQIDLAWTDNSTDEDGFRIERGADGITFTEIATVGTNVTNYSNGGLAAGTTYHYRVRAYNAAGNSSYSNSASATTQGSGGQTTTVTFVSVAAEDGWVYESSQGSGVGGSRNATSSYLRAGDSSTRRQYKSILSFDTASIPDGATIVSATLKLRRYSVSGTNPFTTHGACLVDIKGGTGFSGSLSLQNQDFEAAADATQVASLSNALANGEWSTGSLNSTGLGFVNKTGKTQLRVYFAQPHDGDGTTDYIQWYSGDNGTAGNRPVLEVVYQ